MQKSNYFCFFLYEQKMCSFFLLVSSVSLFVLDELVTSLGQCKNRGKNKIKSKFLGIYLSMNTCKAFEKCFHDNR